MIAKLAQSGFNTFPNRIVTIASIGFLISAVNVNLHVVNDAKRVYTQCRRKLRNSGEPLLLFNMLSPGPPCWLRP